MTWHSPFSQWPNHQSPWTGITLSFSPSEVIGYYVYQIRKLTTATAADALQHADMPLIHVSYKYPTLLVPCRPLGRGALRRKWPAWSGLTWISKANARMLRVFTMTGQQGHKCTATHRSQIQCLYSTIFHKIVWYFYFYIALVSNSSVEQWPWYTKSSPSWPWNYFALKPGWKVPPNDAFSTLVYTYNWNLIWLTFNCILWHSTYVYRVNDPFCSFVIRPFSRLRQAPKNMAKSNHVLNCTWT